MASMSTAAVIGNLGQKPELKFTPSGTAVCNMSVAVSEKVNGVEKTDWFKVVAWGKTAENCAQYLDKGRAIYAQGQLKTNVYTNKEGQKVTSVFISANTVVFLGGGKNEHQEANGDVPAPPPGRSEMPGAGGPDDIPF